MTREVKPGQVYKHFKGNKYQIVTVATDSDTDKKVVVYKALYGEENTFTRDYDEFLSPVDKVKYPEVTQEYRFELLDEDDTSGVDPRLLQFLEADTYNKKYELLRSYAREIDDELIDSIAASLDVVVPDGRLEERFASLKECVDTFRRFEVTDRLR